MYAPAPGVISSSSGMSWSVNFVSVATLDSHGAVWFHVPCTMAENSASRQAGCTAVTDGRVPGDAMVGIHGQPVEYVARVGHNASNGGGHRTDIGGGDAARYETAADKLVVGARPIREGVEIMDVVVVVGRKACGIDSIGEVGGGEVREKRRQQDGDVVISATWECEDLEREGLGCDDVNGVTAGIDNGS